MSEANEDGKQTGRVEAFSDGVFAIALTLLAIDLKAPVLELVNSRNLAHALAMRWTEYFAFVNSFASVLLIWASHHQVFRLIRRTNARVLLANGLLLFFVSAVPYPTSVLARYIATDAASVAAAFYAGYCILVEIAFILLWRVASKNKRLLASNVTDEQTRKMWRGLMFPLPIYGAALLFAFVNGWITVAITTLLWIYWAAVLKEDE